jgi:hypothetical protein
MNAVASAPAAGVGPTFVIVGAMKASTSSLHSMLGQHPDVFVTRSKELHYWERPQRAPLDEYHAHFADGAGHAARGESTPSYAAQPGAIAAMAEYRPELKLIFLMRDPVKRAISHLQQAARRGDAGMDMHAALDAELAALPSRLGKPFVPLAGSYHWRGHYAGQIDVMRRHFPAGQLLLLRMEDLLADVPGHIGTLCRFLGVSQQPLTMPHANKPRRIIPVPDGVVERLSDYYRPLNRELHERHGIRTDDWL